MTSIFHCSDTCIQYSSPIWPLVTTQNFEQNRDHRWIIRKEFRFERNARNREAGMQELPQVSFKAALTTRSNVRGEWPSCTCRYCLSKHCSWNSFSNRNSE